MIRFILTALCFALIMPSLSHAKGSVNVGDVIPTNLEFKDQNGKTRNFSELTGKKGMVLVFVRSLEWCPFCQKQVIELDKNKQKFSDEGYSIVSISYDEIANIKKFLTTNNPKITLLSDPASTSIRAFDILNAGSAKGTMSYGIPYPGVFIVDKDKKVQAKFFKEGYENRATVSELLDKIKALNTPPEPEMTMDNMGEDPILPEDQFIETPVETLDPILAPTTSIPAEGAAVVPAENNPAEVMDTLGVEGMNEDLTAPAPLVAPTIPATSVMPVIPVTPAAAPVVPTTPVTP